MMSEQEKKNENHEIKKTFVPFCRNNYSNVVDEKSVHIFDNDLSLCGMVVSFWSDTRAV